MNELRQSSKYAQIRCFLNSLYSPIVKQIIQVMNHAQNLYVEMAACLSRYYYESEEYAAAIALCQKLLQYDNCHEESYRRIMCCHVKQNQRHLAIRQYLQCKETLAAELNISPSPETEALYQQLL